MSSTLSARGAPGYILLIAAIFCAFEAAFALTDAGILPIEEMRGQVYLYGAFFDPYFEELLAGREVPATFWSSWLTHAFLHGGVLHVAMNTAVFLGLGSYIARGIGPLRFAILFVVTAVAGALFFAVISDTYGPMIGASGVLFGLIGALKFWEWRYIRMTGAAPNRFWGTIIGLIILNVALAFSFPGEGSLAWEAHLGGFVAGFLIAPILAPNAAGPSPI